MTRTLPLLTLASCLSAPSEIQKEDLPRYGAEVVCARIRECDRATYDSQYFGKSDCRDEWELGIAETVDAADDLGCDYDATAAGTAWQDIHDMTCEEYAEGKAEETLFLIWVDCF